MLTRITAALRDGVARGLLVLVRRRAAVRQIFAVATRCGFTFSWALRFCAGMLNLVDVRLLVPVQAQHVPHLAV
jgi:hypothetical protein